MKIALRSVPKQPRTFDLDVAKRDIQCNVANARIWAFEDECARLGEMVHGEPVDRIQMIDFLQSVAEANGLVRAHGDGLIQLMIVTGLRGGK